MKFPETKTLQPGSIKRTGLWWRRSDGPFYLDPEAQTQLPPPTLCACFRRWVVGHVPKSVGEWLEAVP